MAVNVTRRTLLRGAGAALAVPLLESWPLPLALGAPKKAPLRLLFVYMPNGAHMPDWTPGGEGGPLPSILAPLQPHAKHLTILSGLTLDGARGHGDGPGDHARAGGAFLTCAHPKKTDGADIQAGISVDQVAAKTLGEGTPFPSVELGTEVSLPAGSCDSGYSCAYSSNLAWASPSMPLGKEINPRRAFERLFLDGDGLTPIERARRARLRGSVLDLVRDDAKRARPRLGQNDRRKLDEYLDAVRTLEKRLAGEKVDRSKVKAGFPEPAPGGLPRDYGEHLRRMYDVIGLAFQTDTTRVVTFMVGNEGSNRAYRGLEIPEGHHDLSHHGKDPAKQEKVSRINRFHVEQLAYFVERLKAVKEGDGTLLDSTLIVFGSAIGDGNAHNHDDLPILLVGSAGGAIATGRHLRYKRDTPLANLYLWLLARVGAGVARFGDSTELLPDLSR